MPILLGKLVLVCLFASHLYAVQSIKVNKNTNYTANSVPQKMSVQEKKQRFRDLVVPAVQRVYVDLDAKYKAAKKIVESGKTNIKIEKLMKSYRAKSLQDLLVRMKPHAKSVAIAQAAMESAWATSRFTRVATNLFGVHSIEVDEPRVKASAANNVYVTKYASVEEAIYAYYKILSTGKVFTKFREVKISSNNPYELVKELDEYSVKGALYGEELSAMIKYNRFYEFD
ncbi:glucosaminidase domain-containing protein [Sulfurimonas sp. SAG-AH-194-C21]|nr:glucosaminidase domain-containing protein [Sulfurimonas sp. SAG-AH-194-C21]MDF1883715.1 glucosaminidase domain-containing protein [Sulfurimonas sp. SAG-AH-194-C21]